MIYWRSDIQKWIRPWPVQICGTVLFVLAFWFWSETEQPTHPLLDTSRRPTGKLKQVMDQQVAQYGSMRIGHSSAFEAAPPPEYDGSAPSYFIPNIDLPFDHAPNPPLPKADVEEYVAFCLVVRNQSIDMPEFFIHHYHHHGIRRFYVYDDGTVPQLAEKPYIDSWGIPDEAIDFTYIEPGDVTERKRLQADLYTDCAKRSVGKHKWVAFLDPDEYLEMRGKKPLTLIEFLKKWEKDEKVGALAVHWLNHNSDDHIEKQPGHARKAYKKCLANKPTTEALLKEIETDICGVGHNRNIKTFVQPAHLSSIENIHWVKTKSPRIEVTEHGKKISTWCHWPPTQDHWALHHYVTKSKEDWDLKLGRHRIGGGGVDGSEVEGNALCYAECELSGVGGLCALIEDLGLDVVYGEGGV